MNGECGTNSPHFPAISVDGVSSPATSTSTLSYQDLTSCPLNTTSVRAGAAPEVGEDGEEIVQDVIDPGTFDLTVINSSNIYNGPSAPSEEVDASATAFSGIMVSKLNNS